MQDRNVALVESRALFAELLRMHLIEEQMMKVDIFLEVDSFMCAVNRKENFDVILLSCIKPNENEVSIIEKVIDLTTGRVVILCDHMVPNIFEKLMSLNISGFLQSSMQISQLGHALYTIAEGGFYIPPEYIRKQILSEKKAGKFSLSAREYSILEKLVCGRRNAEISEELCISLPTVKADVRSICIKLGVKNRTAAALKAVQQNIL